VNAVADAVISKTSDMRASSGMSIYMPPLGSSIASWYTRDYAAFDQATGWSDFLSAETTGGRDIPLDWAGGSNRVAARGFNLGATGGTGLSFDHLSLETAGTSDWFRFTLSQQGGPDNRITAAVVGDGVDIRVRVYDVGGTTLLRESGVGESHVSLDGLAAGEFSVRVDANGPVERYALVLNVPEISGDAPVPNNSVEKARHLGAIGSEVLVTGLLAPAANSSTGENWSYFSFDTPAGVVPQQFLMTATSGEDVSLEADLLDESGAIVQSGAGNSNVDISFEPRGAAESYLIRIRQVVASATAFSTQLAAETVGILFQQVTQPEVVLTVGEGETITDKNTYSGNQVIVKRGSGTLILDLANTHSGGLIVEAGTVIIRNVASLNAGPLVIQSGATVLLEVGFKLVDLASLELDAAGRLDVGTGGIRVAAGGFDITAVRQSLIDGRDKGGWNGATGITHSAASGKSSPSSFAVGYTVAASGLLTVRYTAAGDAQLDGKVDFDDILALFPNYGVSGSYSWQDGDFTYDGKVDFDDILALFPNYEASAVFGSGMFGVFGGSGTSVGNGSGSGGNSGSGTGDATASGFAGDANASDTVSMPRAVIGPLPPDSLRQRSVSVLTRTGSARTPGDLGTDSISATSLAFAALATGEPSNPRTTRVTPGS
jgi:autotransporter-associated beta strand protein